MFTEQGYQMVASILKSYTDEGKSYHAALSRYATTADLILNDEERAKIGAAYDRLLRQGNEGGEQ